jgi:hypothetical protein
MATLTGYRADRVGAYIDKDTEAILDYAVDWSDWLPTSETIASSTWTITVPAGDTDVLAVDSNTYTSTVASAIISGGTDGNIYTVSNQIVTADGRRERRNFRIVVKARSV